MIHICTIYEEYNIYQKDIYIDNIILNILLIYDFYII